MHRIAENTAVAGLLRCAILVLALASPSHPVCAQQQPTRVVRPPATASLSKPKLVVLIVVDQMRGDYVDKFRSQWTGGFQRMLREGAWYRQAAYPYAATETCVGHATISTGSFPSTHGMVANAWWDRASQKMVTCTADPQAKDTGYAGVSARGGDSALRMELPSFAEELKLQRGQPTRIVSFALKARASITMAGHKADAVTWFDGGGLATSSVYGNAPFVEEFANAHPVRQDYGKTWTLALPESAYLYPEKAKGAVPPKGWDLTFPHPLRGESAGSDPDVAFYEQWGSSPFADTYLTRLAEASVDALNLGKGPATDFLAIGYSTVDYVGHSFGPRSREIQDVLVHLDKDLGELFAHLDQKVGRGSYVVALSADHGVAPTPEDLESMGVDAGLLRLPELQERIEKALEPFGFAKPAIARISGSDAYLAPDVAGKLKQNPEAMRAVLDAALAEPGVADVYWADQLKNRPATQNPTLDAFADSYYPGRSGDLFIVPKPYWFLDYTPAGKARSYGTGHGVPYDYDQHVPILLMGYGIQPGEYLREVTPADIAPTFALLCGITLASRDGHVLSEAVAQRPRRTTP